MDRSSHKRSIISLNARSACFRVVLYGVFFSFTLSMCDRQLWAEERERTSFTLPEVTIIGNDESKLEPLKQPSQAPLMYEKSMREVALNKEERSFNWVTTAGYGGFDTFYYDITHWGEFAQHSDRGKWRLSTDGVKYQSSFLMKRTDWDRPNSREITQRGALGFAIPTPDKADYLFDGVYFVKEIELPGPTNAQTLSALRKNSGFNLSVAGDYELFDADRCHAEASFRCSKINENLDRPDYNNRLFKIEGSYYRDFLSVGIGVSDNELKDQYNQLLGFFSLKNSSVPLGSNTNVAVGIRVDAQEGFGWRVNPEAICTYKINEATTCRLSGARKFEIADFNDLYLNDNFVEVSPRRLRPLRTSDCEVGFDCWLSRNLRGDLTFFRQEMKDCLIWDDADNNGLYRPTTIAKAYSSGIKIGTDYYLTDRLSQYLSYTYSNVSNKDSSIESLPYYPEHCLRIELSYKSENRFRVDVTGEYTGRQYYDKNEKLTIPGYFLVNSKFSYELEKNLSLFIMIDNLFNEGFDIRNHYPGLGRNILGGVIVKF